jgi:hypothetical protein
MKILFILAAILTLSYALFALAPPYPKSPVIDTITFDVSTHTSAASGSDLWPVTWASDDNLYVSWGDGGGFTGSRVSIGFGKLTGPPESYTGINLPTPPFSGKTAGMVSVGGTLYAWINTQNGSPPDNKLAWSSDFGAHWSLSSWVFPKSDTFFPAGFLNCGKDNALAKDDYVYSYGARWVLTQGKENDLYMCRVHKNNMKDKSKYEYFTGLSNGNPTWSSDVNARKPVFTDPNGVGNQGLANVVYVPFIDRYLMTVAHRQNSSVTHGALGCLGIFDAPAPWGPWTTVCYYDNWINAGTRGSFLGVHFPGKWMKNNGATITLWCIFSGYNCNARYHDRFNLIKSTLIPKVQDNTPPSSPSNLQAVALSESQIKLTWDAAADNESGISFYKILRGSAEPGMVSDLTFTDQGLAEDTQYSYTVTAINGAMLSSSPAGPVSVKTLADNSPPEIVSAYTSGDPTKVTLTFSEKVEGASAQNKANYTISNGIEIQNAALGSDQTSVILTTTAHSENITYTLTVNNVKDVSRAGNTIATDSKSTYKFMAKLIITLKQYFGSDDPPMVVENGFENGAVQANDRSGAMWTDIPPGLGALTYLLTARDDKSNAMGENEVMYKVAASAACTVFALVQVNLSAPSWIASDGWHSTSLQVTADGNPYSVYKKYLHAGDIDLKRHKNGASQGTGYVFKLAGGGPTVELNSRWPVYNNMGINVSPNPFFPVASIKLKSENQIPNSRLLIYDISGRMVTDLTSKITQGRARWNGLHMASGIYLVKWTQGSNIMIKHMFLMK